MTAPLPALMVAVSFIDHINRRDADGLGKLMSSDHQLEVFDEPPLAGREANVEAWRGYFESFPEYLIHPHLTAEDNGVVAVLGHTTGSHLRLPDEVETKLTLIWVAHTADGMVSRWRLVEDTPNNRLKLGLG